jgi:hypothetical protein
MMVLWSWVMWWVMCAGGRFHDCDGDGDVVVMQWWWSFVA